MRVRLRAIYDKYQSLSEPVKASLWYTICNVLNKGFSLLTTPIFTRILTEEEYGIFAVFQSWYSIILIFSSLNIFLGGYTKGLLLYREDRERFTSSLLSLTTIITCCIGIIYLLNVDFWTRVFNIPPVLMAFMFIELTVMPAIEFWSARERFDFKYKKYVIVSLAMSVLSLCGGAAAVILSDNKLEARVYSDVLAKAVFAVVIYVMLLVRGRTIYVKEYWLYALKFNIPLLPHYLSQYVLNQSDRIMISRMIGNDKAAFYSVAYTISMMMLLIVNAINSSLTPFLYKLIDKIEREEDTYQNVRTRIRKVVTPLLVLVSCLCIITMAFAPEVICIFGGAKYAEAIYVIPPIAASVYFIFVYSVFSNIEYYYQKTSFIALATTLSAGLNLILNNVCIRKYGYFAAGYTTLLCYICLSICHYIGYKITLKKEICLQDELYDIKAILLNTAVVLLAMLLMTFCYRYILLRYTIVLLLFVFIVMKKDFLIEMIKTFK